MVAERALDGEEAVFDGEGEAGDVFAGVGLCGGRGAVVEGGGGERAAVIGDVEAEGGAGEHVGELAEELVLGVFAFGVVAVEAGAEDGERGAIDDDVEAAGFGTGVVEGASEGVGAQDDGFCGFFISGWSGDLGFDPFGVGFEEAHDFALEELGGEGFGDVASCAEGEDLADALGAGVRGDDEDGDLFCEVAALELLDEGDAIHDGHVDVREDEVDGDGFKQGERLLSVGGFVDGADLEGGHGEAFAQEVAHGAGVVDDQNVMHGIRVPSY
jgi:hypothetical protein